jgi:hypothetical protein
LARVFPDDGLLVALPLPYLRAVADDLRDAAAVAGPERLTILSAGGELPGLGAWHAPADARLQRRVGGARPALNARLARLALDVVGERFSGRRLREQFGALMAEPCPRVVPRGAASTDDEVRTFIRQALSEAPGMRATPLLRRYRQSGRACEYSRFMKLYRSMEGKSDGN